MENGQYGVAKFRRGQRLCRQISKAKCPIGCRQIAKAKKKVLGPKYVHPGPGVTLWSPGGLARPLCRLATDGSLFNGWADTVNTDVREWGTISIPREKR